MKTVVVQFMAITFDNIYKILEYSINFTVLF